MTASIFSSLEHFEKNDNSAESTYAFAAKMNNDVKKSDKSRFTVYYGPIHSIDSLISTNKMKIVFRANGSIESSIIVLENPMQE